ncbi:MAG: murein L,D-transpeptidase catalytic domain-containing protein [Bdellovibrionales bacterium]
MTPAMDQSLWGLGSIPSVAHLGEVLGTRRPGDFCGNEYKSLQVMQKKINPSQIPKTLQTLRDAVKPFGISQKMLDKTVAVFLRNQTLIPNQHFITIFDHTQPSTEKRFVVVDLWKGIAKGYRSSHGSGSDPKHTLKAQTFGNDPRGSTNKSSIGCALANHKYRAKVTKQEPKGRWALSILGFESTNDRSCDRGVYMHAAPYVSYQKDVSGSAQIFDSRPGRSWGCPAFNYADRDEVFNQIDGGGLVCSWGN